MCKLYVWCMCVCDTLLVDYDASCMYTMCSSSNRKLQLPKLCSPEKSETVCTLRNASSTTRIKTRRRKNAACLHYNLGAFVSLYYAMAEGGLVTVLGTVYGGPRSYGDFRWMIDQPEYQDSLFIFNDNEEHHTSFQPGGGNATIRRFNRYNPQLPKPRSAGVPTGARGRGYAALTKEVKITVDNSIAEARELIRTHGYRRVFYSAEQADGLLGVSIFAVHDAVRGYITEQIKTLSYARLA